MLKKLILTGCVILTALTASAQTIKYVDAATLNVIGKALDFAAGNVDIAVRAVEERNAHRDRADVKVFVGDHLNGL